MLGCGALTQFPAWLQGMAGKAVMVIQKQVRTQAALWATGKLFRRLKNKQLLCNLE